MHSQSIFCCPDNSPPCLRGKCDNRKTTGWAALAEMFKNAGMFSSLSLSPSRSVSFGSISPCWWCQLLLSELSPQVWVCLRLLYLADHIRKYLKQIIRHSLCPSSLLRLCLPALPKLSCWLSFWVIAIENASRKMHNIHTQAHTHCTYCRQIVLRLPGGCQMQPQQQQQQKQEQADETKHKLAGRQAAALTFARCS